MAGNDTAALVVALSAQLTKFEKDMKQAVDTADDAAGKIETRFAKINPSFLSASFWGNLASNAASKAMSELIKFLDDSIKRFIDLERVAKLAAISMNDLFGLQQAAAKFGVPIEDATASARELSNLLNQMKRGEQNSLTRLFDANPALMRDVNRETITWQQALEKVSLLVKQANTEWDKIDIARLAGQTESMVKVLEKGPDTLRKIQKAAADSAPDLKKLADGAKEFDRQWKLAVDNIKTYIVGELPGAIRSALTTIADLMIAFGNRLPNVPGPFGDLPKRVTEEWKKVKEQIQETNTFAERFSGEPRARVEVHPSRGAADTSTADPNLPRSRLPQQEQERTAFDRLIDQITKKTAATEADTAATFLNNAAQAQLRAEYQLLNSLVGKSNEVTEAQLKEYEKLRPAMEQQQALTAAGIKLTDAHNEAFKRVSNNVGEATSRYGAAQQQLQLLNQASSTLGSALGNAFADAVVEGKKLNEVLSSLIKTLEKAVINQAFGALFNAPSTGGVSPFLRMFGYAGGTNYAPGGLALVGEQGPEIVNLPRGSQVIPNNVLTRAANDNGPTTIAFAIDVRGATGNTEIARMVQAGMAAAVVEAEKSMSRKFVDTAAVANARYRA